MKLSKGALTCLLMAVVFLFAGATILYGGSIPGDPWLRDPEVRGYDEWSGTLFIVPEIVVSASPADCAPIAGFQDYVVKLSFYLKLKEDVNRNADYRTYSGVGVANDGSGLFCLLFDHGSFRVGEAVQNFLQAEVYPDLCASNTCGRFTSVLEESGNVLEQTQVPGPGLDPADPMYYSMEIKVQVP